MRGNRLQGRARAPSVAHQQLEVPLAKNAKPILSRSPRTRKAKMKCTIPQTHQLAHAHQGDKAPTLTELICTAHTRMRSTHNSTERRIVLRGGILGHGTLFMRKC